MLLYDDALPRKLARVQELITGRDGKPRGAVVKVPAKSGGMTSLRHPLQLLYPPEIWRSNAGIGTNREESLLNSWLTIK